MHPAKSRQMAPAFIAVLLGASLAVPLPPKGQAPEPAVHVVLFFSPTCPHCHTLINDHLIPLQEEYGRKLVILALDVSQGWANEIYWAALRKWEVPQEDWVVPIALIAEDLVIGGIEIPARLRSALDEGLAGDGVDLPDFPALLTFLEGEDALDPRYPGRRILRQAPPEESEQEPVDPEPDAPTQGDSVGQTPQDPPPSPDTTEAGTPDQEDPPLPSEEAPPPSGEADVPADPGTEGGEPRPSQAEVSVPTTPGADDAPPLPPEETEAPTDRPPETESPGDSAGVPGPMDLSAAARELESMTMMDRFNQDPTGNSLSVVVLLGLLASLGLRGFPPRTGAGMWPAWIIPSFVAVGIGVAGYLSFIEVTHSPAVCGPVGDCNTVNQSAYATLFGFLPVGILGLLGYGLILVFWSLGRWGPEGVRDSATLALWAAAFFGTIFSVYLTFLEPFVIGATCVWCLSSAVIMALLLWATAPLAAAAWPGAPDETLS
jgi:uncharacterized membrane protein/thiol-disulfide isomerase/thioredoxin